MSATDPNLQNILGHWLDWIAHGKRLSKHTVRAYETDVADFLEFLNKHTGTTVTVAKLADATLTDFRAWVAAKAMKHVTARSRARAVPPPRHLQIGLAR